MLTSNESGGEDKQESNVNTADSAGMRTNYFHITEFIINPAMRVPEAAIPVHVADKIINHHLPILNNLRAAFGSPVIVSEYSGYRPVSWEKDHGRSGESEHTFKGKGAVDITVRNRVNNFHELLMRSDYNRICWYPDKGFWHCDFARTDNEKLYFENRSDGWELQHYRQ